MPSRKKPVLPGSRRAPRRAPPARRPARRRAASRARAADHRPSRAAGAPPRRRPRPWGSPGDRREHWWRSGAPLPPVSTRKICSSAGIPGARSTWRRTTSWPPITTASSCRPAGSASWKRPSASVEATTAPSTVSVAPAIGCRVPFSSTRPAIGMSGGTNVGARGRGGGRGQAIGRTAPVRRWAPPPRRPADSASHPAVRPGPLQRLRRRASHAPLAGERPGRDEPQAQHQRCDGPRAH